MSWDKNTIVVSQIDQDLRLLEKFGIPYELKELGRVMGHGLNDCGDKFYSIRRLEFGDEVVLEQMHRTDDCDADDTIISMVFEKGKEPKEWPLEIMEEAIYLEDEDGSL